VPLQPGVRDVNIQSGLLTNNVNGLVLSASPTQPLTNVTISHISVAQVCLEEALGVGYAQGSGAGAEQLRQAQGCAVVASG
jgi:hypothetical protein